MEERHDSTDTEQEGDSDEEDDVPMDIILGKDGETIWVGESPPINRRTASRNLVSHWKTQ